MRIIDLYSRLGLSRNATTKEIKNAYYKLSKKYHPDLNDGSAESVKKFREITEAYKVLGNDTTKAQYDRDTPQATYTPKRSQTQPIYKSSDEMNARDRDIGEKIRFYREQMRKRNQYSNTHSYRNANPNQYQYTKRRVYESPDWFSAHYGSEFSWTGYKTKSENSGIRKEKSNENNKTKAEQLLHEEDKLNFNHVYRKIEDFERQIEQWEKIKMIFAQGVIGVMIFILLCCCVKLILSDYNYDEYKKKKE